MLSSVGGETVEIVVPLTRGLPRRRPDRVEDQVGDDARMGDHREVPAVDLDGRGAHPVRHEPLEVGRGGVWSCFETAYQLGRLRHAAAVVRDAKSVSAMRPCTA